MTFTINGFTEQELDARRAAAAFEAADDLVRLRLVADRGRSAVAVNDAEAAAIARQQSLGAKPSRGGGTPAEEVRQAKLRAFRDSDAARIPGMVRQGRAAEVAEAERRLAELRGSMVTDGDAAEEMRRDRLLGQVRTQLGEDAPIIKALNVLESQAGDRNKLGLVRDELRARYPEHSALIDQHVTRIDPQLAAAQTAVDTARHDYTVIDQVAKAVENGIKTGNMPSTAFFDNVAKAVKRQ